MYPTRRASRNSIVSSWSSSFFLWSSFWAVRSWLYRWVWASEVMTSPLIIDRYVSAGRSWLAMAARTERGDICPRARRWFLAVAGPAGIGAWGAGGRSLGILGSE